MRKLAIVLISVVMLAAMTGSVYAQQGPPPLPSSFWGTVRVNGSDVPANTVISAWIGGTRYAYRPVMYYAGWGTVYALDVPGDQAGTLAKEGGVAGDVITFRIGVLPATQTGAWRSGTNVRLDLTATRVPADKKCAGGVCIVPVRD